MVATMVDVPAARMKTQRAFDTVRSRVRVADTFAVAAHASLGAAFGAMLAWMGQGGIWWLMPLIAGGAAGSGLWALARLPVVAAGRVIERRFPECRNVLVTADELLEGSLEASDGSAARVFHRAADLLGRIDLARAARIAPRVGVSALTIFASALVVLAISRALLSGGR